MRVNCLSQEQNTMSLAKARTWTAGSGDEHMTQSLTQIRLIYTCIYLQLTGSGYYTWVIDQA